MCFSPLRVLSDTWLQRLHAQYLCALQDNFSCVTPGAQDTETQTSIHCLQVGYFHIDKRYSDNAADLCAETKKGQLESL